MRFFPAATRESQACNSETIEANRGPAGAPAFVQAGYWAHAVEIDRTFAVLEEDNANHDDSLLQLKDRRVETLKAAPQYKHLLRAEGSRQSAGGSRQ